MCLRGRQFAELCCNAHKLRATRPRHAELVDGAAARAEELGRGTARGVAADARRGRRVLRQRLRNVEQPGRHVVRLRRAHRRAAERRLSSAPVRRNSARSCATPSDSAWPRSTEAIRPLAPSRTSMRASSSAARAISSTDASMRRSAKRLRNASSCSIGSARRNCHDAGHDERAQRAEQRVDVRSRHAVLHKQRRCVAPSARALGRCRAALGAPSARCAAARRQTPARASRRRARRRAAARAPPTARRRARQCTARARRPAATQRHGDEAARRNAHLREAQQRLAVDAALQDRRDARAPRRAAPAEHVHQRRRQVERARLRTRAADRRRVHRVAEPLEVQRVGEPCDAARVNAVHDEAQRRRRHPEVEPVTAAEAAQC
jgi:hypothetical protein